MTCLFRFVFLLYITVFEIWYASGFSITNEVLINSPDIIRDVKLIKTWAAASVTFN